MGNLTVNGIVCRYTNYRENDRILTLFTREHGRIDVAARGCRKPKSPLLAASEPFVYAEYTLFKSKDKYSVDQAEVQEAFYPLRSDIDRFSAGMILLPFAASAEPGEPNEEMFSLLYHALTFLAYGEVPPEDMVFCFLLRHLDIYGYRPAIMRCAKCGADLRQLSPLGFSPYAGGALCPACIQGKPVQKLTLEAMRRILRLNNNEMEKVRLPHKVRLELREILYPYAEHALERKIKQFEPIEEKT